ncbi:hypothetical protein ARALYDRAFT_891937 [Arabidopsis lyrata subsp. lyrata]|uniref:Uncharacterized protein n=1 Tax=Arabidopsis lyrata subsp. lyrata TaxID=81972 RepID=D7KFV7_ARALL|nr:hypothetical protein ARALYDRAFT_891937 [Arabidopsis lyrata subsp. lyrata]
MLKDFFDGKEPNKGTNPDEVLAYTTAVQGGVLSGEGGEETQMSRAWKKSQVFTTYQDQQTTVTINVYEEISMTKDNPELRNFQLTGLLPAPR